MVFSRVVLYIAVGEATLEVRNIMLGRDNPVNAACGLSMLAAAGAGATLMTLSLLFRRDSFVAVWLDAIGSMIVAIATMLLAINTVILVQGAW